MLRSRLHFIHSSPSWEQYYRDLYSIRSVIISRTLGKCQIILCLSEVYLVFLTIFTNVTDVLLEILEKRILSFENFCFLLIFWMGIRYVYRTVYYGRITI